MLNIVNVKKYGFTTWKIVNVIEVSGVSTSPFYININTSVGDRTEILSDKPKHLCREQPSDNTLRWGKQRVVMGKTTR